MAYLNFLKRLFDGSGTDNTPEGALIRSGGKSTMKTITLSANNTSESINVFQLTGSVLVLSTYGEVVDATTLNNLTGAYFDLWDGTNSVEITKAAGGATMSGFGVGGFLIKDSNVSNLLTVINNDQCRVTEASAGNKLRADWVATQKTGTNTYIRFNYTTTDAPINAQIKINIEWADVDNGEITSV